MTRKGNVRRPRRSAFTLIEMLIVIALIALIAGLVVNQMGNVQDNAMKDAAKLFVDTSLDAPLFSYKTHLGNFPTSTQGLQALITAPEGSTRWRGPYIKGNAVPLDPWKNPYQYRYPGTKNPRGYDVFSWGPDGVESEDDIGNW
jgi:general secretion pathway protein G